MRNFSFNAQNDNELQDIESILQQRKHKIAKQQLIYTIILTVILAIFILWLYHKTVYVEFDGYVSVDVNTLRPDEDVYFLESDFRVGDLIVPGDTVFSYVIAHNFYGHEKNDYEPEILSRNRDIKVQYGLACQDLNVLKVRIVELERQLKTEDHNIRLGLSDNHNKLRTEQALSETREQYKSLLRKINVLRNAVNQTEKSVARLNNNGYGYLNLSDMRNISLLDSLGLIRYSVAVDSAIVTKKFVATFSLVLRGEAIMSTQSIDLYHNNISVVAYVMPDEMKYVNYHSVAEVIINDEISYAADVLMLGARTEEIPGELRSTLSRDHTASIVVFDISPNQNIPFWSLTNGVPARVRINKIKNRLKQEDDYIIYNTSNGVDVSKMNKWCKKQRKGLPKYPTGMTDSDTEQNTTSSQSVHTDKLPQPQTERSDMPIHPAKAHHIIVASSVKKNDAQNMVEALRQNGYKEASILTCNGKNRVSIGSFATNQEAVQALRRLKKHPEYSTAWVYKLDLTKKQ